MKTDLAVLTDFDGTVATINVLDSLYEVFGGPSYRQVMGRWVRGEISTMEEIEQIFGTFQASRQEMEAFLSTVEFDPGFKPLLNLCRERDIPFAIVSDGLRWYIDYILRDHGIENVKVFAGEIVFEEAGFRFEFPWFDPTVPMRSTAKPLIVKEYQSRGYRVHFIGDGLSDIEAASAADIVYAKDILLQEAEERGIVVREFGNLRDIYKDLLSGTDLNQFRFSGPHQENVN